MSQIFMSHSFIPALIYGLKVAFATNFPFQFRKRSRPYMYVQHLSPKKLSRKVYPCYTFQVQTSPSRSEKLVGYSSSQYQELEKVQEVKSPVNLSKLNMSYDDHIFNDQSHVSRLKPFDIKFTYADVDCASSPLSSVSSKNINIGDLKEYEPFSSNIFTVREFVSFGDGDLKTVSTKFGTICKVKENCRLKDQTGSVAFHVWESTYQLL